MATQAHAPLLQVTVAVPTGSLHTLPMIILLIVTFGLFQVYSSATFLPFSSNCSVPLIPPSDLMVMALPQKLAMRSSSLWTA